MTRRTLIALLVALLVGGVIAYGLWSRAPAEPQVAVEECEDKPPPNEFAMAAECEGDEAPGAEAVPGSEGGGGH